MSLRRHTLMNLVGAVAPLVISLITVPAYLKLIGPERYGALAVLWVLLGYFGLFDLGLGRAVAQRMSRLTDAEPERRTRLAWTALATTVALSIVGGGALAISSNWFVTTVLNTPAAAQQEALIASRWLALLLPVALTSGVLLGTLQARLRFFALNSAQLIGTVLGQTLPLLTAWTGLIGLDSLVPAVLAARVITLLYVAKEAQRAIPLQAPVSFDRAELHQLLTYGGWISVTAILGPLLVTIDRLVLAGIAGTKAVAYYTVPYDLAFKGVIVAGAVSSALVPRLASSSAIEAVRLADKATDLLSAVMTPLVLTAIFVVNPVLRLWIGAEMADNARHVAELIFIGVWIHAVMTPHSARLLAADSPRTIVVLYLVQIPPYFVLLWLGISYAGVAGAAAAWAIRVGLDALLVLRAAHALESTWESIRFKILPLLLGLTIVLLLESTSTMRNVSGFALIGLALYMSREFIVQTFAEFRQRLTSALGS